MNQREYRRKMNARSGAERVHRRLKELGCADILEHGEPKPPVTTASIARATGKTQREIRAARELALARMRVVSGIRRGVRVPVDSALVVRLRLDELGAAIASDPKRNLSIDQVRERLARAGII